MAGSIPSVQNSSTWSRAATVSTGTNHVVEAVLERVDVRDADVIAAEVPRHEPEPVPQAEVEDVGEQHAGVPSSGEPGQAPVGAGDALQPLPQLVRRRRHVRVRVVRMARQTTPLHRDPPIVGDTDERRAGNARMPSKPVPLPTMLSNDSSQPRASTERRNGEG